MSDILNVKVNGEWVGIPAIKGDNGQDGQGVPTGGTTGQVITKKTNTDFDTEWKTLTASDVGALPDDTIIPTVNNATLTITQGGTSKGTFTANASTDVTIGIDNPAWGSITGTLADQTDLDTALSGKADTSLSNTTDAGKIAIAHNAMPSNTKITVTIGATGATYTAPADGYYCATGNSGYIYLKNESIGNDKFYQMVQLGSGVDGSCILPVKKGTTVMLWWSGTTMQSFTFVYAQGSESEAS